MSDKKELLKNMFSAIFENSAFDLTPIKKYFHPDYVQHVDGNTLDFDQFVSHIKTLKASTNSITITFEQLIVDGAVVASIHYPEATKKNGNRIKAKVIAFFTFQGNKLIRCDELTHLIMGDEEDKDLGSKH